MGNLSLILALCILGPLAMMLFVFRGNQRVILAFLMSGIFMCLLAGEINGLILAETKLDLGFLTVNVTPIVEEALKSLPIVFIAFMWKPDEPLLLASSVAVGVGFAILENAYILSGMVDSVSIPWALMRVFGAGMVHGICTLAVGWAMSYVYGKRKMFFAGTFAAFSAAVIFHSIYNMLIGSDHRIIAFIMPTLVFIPLVIATTKKSKNRQTPKK